MMAPSWLFVCFVFSCVLLTVRLTCSLLPAFVCCRPFCVHLILVGLSFSLLIACSVRPQFLQILVMFMRCSGCHVFRVLLGILLVTFSRFSVSVVFLPCSCQVFLRLDENHKKSFRWLCSGSFPQFPSYRSLTADAIAGYRACEICGPVGESNLCRIDSPHVSLTIRTRGITTDNGLQCDCVLFQMCSWCFEGMTIILPMNSFRIIQKDLPNIIWLPV